MSMQKTQIKNSKKLYQEKLIAMLVKNLTNVFTSPDKALFLFDDEATFCRDKDPDEEDDDDDEEG